MTGRCQGTTRKGASCTASVAPGVRWCFNHDPAREAERRRNAARAGRSRPSQEVLGLKGQLQVIADGVLDGSVVPGQGAVAVQALNALARVLELERRWREIGEIEARLEVLEAILARPLREEGRWGA